MSRKLSLNQLEELISVLKTSYKELDVRIVVDLPAQSTLGEMISFLKSQGYAAHPETSAYSEREVVITTKY